TFLMVPRMSVNCSRMNLTFSRSVRSRICVLVSLALPEGVVLAMVEILTVSQLFGPNRRLKERLGRGVHENTEGFGCSGGNGRRRAAGADRATVRTRSTSGCARAARPCADGAGRPRR